MLLHNYWEPRSRCFSTPERARGFVGGVVKLGVIAGVLLVAVACRGGSRGSLPSHPPMAPAMHLPASAAVPPLSGPAAPQGFAIASRPLGLSPTPVPTCAPAWRTVSSPDPGTDVSLYAVSALSSSDVWAVGNNY